MKIEPQRDSRLISAQNDMAYFSLLINRLFNFNNLNS